MKSLFRYFLQGLIYVIPIGVTLYILYLIVRFILSLVVKLDFIDMGWSGKISALVGTVLLICLIGYYGQKLLSSPLTKMAIGYINRVPLVRVIYTSVRDLMNAFVGKERKFGTAVLVKLDSEGLVQRIGFITAEDLSQLSIKDHVAVILPNSYGLLGELLIVPTASITKIDANSADIMKFIVSGGVTSIDEARRKRESQE